MNVRMCQALDNENEPTWKEVKSMKDILGGCSPNSPEGIELNLARATKSAGLKTDDLRAALTAQKTMHALGVDPVQMAKIMNIQKVIAENGVPSVEIARVLQVKKFWLNGRLLTTLYNDSTMIAKLSQLSF